MVRDSGRTCGCDPAENHVCSDHAAHVDDSVSVFENAAGDNVIVSGPNSDGLFTLATEAGYEDGARVQVERFVLEDIINELARRLAERAR